MVKNNIPLKKHAFTMIELIFAIVIIAITVMSLPMVTQVTNKNIENSLVQEAVFASSAELMDATAGYWDERSMEDINTSHLSRVIDNISSICDNNASSQRYRLLPGHIDQPYHRRCLDSNSSTSPSLDQTSNSSIYSLDDTSGSAVLYVNPVNGSAEGYKEDYNRTITVTRNGDIKLITVTVKDENNEDVTVLRTQSANIGEIDFYRRRF